MVSRAKHHGLIPGTERCGGRYVGQTIGVKSGMLSSNSPTQQFSICLDRLGINPQAGIKSTLKRTGEYLVTGFQPVLYTRQRF